MNKNKKAKINWYSKKYGITLISLVITIVVMLILAGVAISITVDPEGLFGQAEKAKTDWNAQTVEESENMKDALAYFGIYHGSSDDWEIEGTTIVAYKGDKTTYTDIVIPGYVDGVAVDTIGNNLFESDTYATSLKISEGIKVIGEYAFASCKNIKTNLIIPNSVTTISGAAFVSSGFTGALIIPDNVTTIGTTAFAACSGFTSISIGKSVETIGLSAFASCEGMSGHLTLPTSIREIGIGSFASCGFETVTVPDTVGSVGNAAFNGNGTVYYKGTLDTSNWGTKVINE